jgi:hypothetical protein
MVRSALRLMISAGVWGGLDRPPAVVLPHDHSRCLMCPSPPAPPDAPPGDRTPDQFRKDATDEQETAPGFPGGPR